MMRNTVELAKIVSIVSIMTRSYYYSDPKTTGFDVIRDTVTPI